MKRHLFAGSAKSFRWSLIIDKLLDDFSFKVADRHARRNLLEGYPNLIAPINDFVGRAASYQGFYEKKSLDAFVDFFLPVLRRKGRVNCFIDVGANIGNHSVYFSRFFAKIYSFEVSRKIFEILSINLKEAEPSCPGCSIKAINLGVYSRTTSGKVIVEDPANQGSGRILVPDKNIESNENPTDNQLVSLDDFASGLESFLEPDLIKLDIEGLEYEAICGARNLITEYHPIVMVEVHEDEFKLGLPKSLRKLSEYGYSVFSCTDYTQVAGLSPLAKILQFLFPVLEGSFVRTPSLLRFSLDDLPQRSYEFIIAIPPWFFDE